MDLSWPCVGLGFNYNILWNKKCPNHQGESIKFYTLSSCLPYVFLFQMSIFLFRDCFREMYGLRNMAKQPCEKYFWVVFIWIQFIIPILILVYCYGRIVWVLAGRISTKPQQKQDNILTTQTNTFQVAKTNTIKTFLLVAVCFVVCCSNNQIYYLMYNLGYPADWSGTYSQFSVLMVFLNCTVNPFIYLIKYKDYQKALKKICRCNRQDHKTQTASTITSTVEISK